MSSTTAARTSSLLVLGVFYFLCYGALGALYPFLPLLLAARGLTPQEISWILVLIPLFNLLMPPLWGSLADALRARIGLLRLAAFGSGLGALLFLPRWHFWGSFLALATFSFFRAPQASLVDATTVDAMVGREHDFGRVRVWGSVGFAGFALLMGQLQGSEHPLLLLSVNSLIYLLAGFAALTLHTPPLQRERGVLRQSLQVLARPALWIFLLGSTCYYFGHSIYDAYFSLHLRGLGFADSFIGSAWAVGVAMEIGIMQIAPRFLHHVPSSRFLCLAALASVLRWSLLSFVTSAGALLLQQSLHGLTFGLWYLSLVRYVQHHAPDRLRTSLQAAGLATMGLGAIVGYLAGGAVFHHAGGASAYRLAAASAALSLLLYLVVAGLDRPAPAALPPGG